MLHVMILAAIADWLVNLSAGWFGAALIIPAISRRPDDFNSRIAVENVAIALALLAVAIYIRNIIPTV